MNKKRIMKIAKYAERVNSDADPVSIQVGLTDNCFNKCHMCSHHKRKDKYTMPAKQWIDFLKQRAGIESVCYSGGDFMAHPEANKIMEYHISSGKAFGLLTAGYAPNTIDLSLLSKARWVRVSLDTIDPKTYNRIRGGDLNPEMILISINKMRAAGVNVELTITVSDLSYPKLNEVFAFAWENKIALDIHPLYGKEFTTSQLSFIEGANLIFHQKGIPFQMHAFNSHSFSQCKAAYYQCFIDSRGFIYPCCNAAGDTKQESRMQELGHISDWENFLQLRYVFSNLKADELPSFCEQCIDRFRYINHFCGDMPFQKSFF